MKFYSAAVLLLFCLKALGAAVALKEDGTAFTLTNQLLTVRIEKRSGDLVSLKYQGVDMLGRGKGYWSFVGGGRGSSERSSTITIDPGNGGKRAEVACLWRYDRQPGSIPADIEMRYSLGRDEHSIYVYAIWKHTRGDPGFAVGEARYAVKLNPEIFDYMTIDKERRRIMPTGEDWDHGTDLNMKEARRMTTGRYKGEVEHKYDYSAVLSETPAYGWSSSEKKVGFWLINPSFEYIAGGPTKVELTGHLDVNPGGLPTLLNMWLGSHYGGSSLVLAPEEQWTKVIGPFLLYCNSDGDEEQLWTNALNQAAVETKAWPYDWVHEPNYRSAKERGTIEGRITFRDPAAPGLVISNLQVGVSAPDYQARGTTVDWQRDAKYCQFWTRGDKSGRFSIKNVIPGKYTLHAIADGVPGEFTQPNITVTARKDTLLGRMKWEPRRYGKTLWEIGIPDRTAREFRHGDHFWKWGLYYEYPKEFPNDVNFVVGKSDWRRDWNYCQPPRIDGQSARGTTWSIAFESPTAQRGKATLRLAIAGSRARRGIDVTVNDKEAGNTGPLPDTGVMHRDGIRGYWCERLVAFDAALLKSGTNVIKLTVPARNWVEGVLYDYLRLEVE